MSPITLSIVLMISVLALSSLFPPLFNSTGKFDFLLLLVFILVVPIALSGRPAFVSVVFVPLCIVVERRAPLYGLAVHG